VEDFDRRIMFYEYEDGMKDYSGNELVAQQEDAKKKKVRPPQGGIRLC